MTIAPELDELADRLVAARRDGQQIQTLPPELVPADTDGSYTVNRLVAERLDWPVLGWKIAGTTDEVRRKLNLSSPIYGRTFQRHVMRSPASMVIETLLDPLVECEFFVTLGQDLPPREAPWTMEEVIAAIDTVHAGIEVAECRFPTTLMPPLTAVLADGSASGHYVFGGELPDWRAGLADVEVVLEIDGTPKRFGRGSDVMGDPLAPLLWLANIRRDWGDGLRAGETISTGSTTGMLPIRREQTVRATFGGQATVEIAFTNG